MASAQLKISEIDSTHYRLTFESAGAKVVCEVSVDGASGSKKSTAGERKQAAMHKAKTLTRAFHEAIDA